VINSSVNDATENLHPGERRLCHFRMDCSSWCDRLARIFSPLFPENKVRILRECFIGRVRKRREHGGGVVERIMGEMVERVADPLLAGLRRVGGMS